jgi:hypothetical protein
MPYLSDACKGIKCGNCEKVGPQLMKCPCGKVYYCNKDCLKAKWAEHKAEHRAVMARKSARK